MLIKNHLVTGIPNNANIAYNGSIFKVYKWDQEFFDGTKSTFERVVVQGSVIIIPITDHNTVILAEQTQPGRDTFTGFIGGRVEENEHPLDAAKRELLEESGISGVTWTKIGTWSPFCKVFWPQHYFIVKQLTASPITHTDNSEKINLLVLSIDNFYNLILSDNFTDYIFKSIYLSMILKHGKPNNFEELMSLTTQL